MQERNCVEGSPGLSGGRGEAVSLAVEKSGLSAQLRKAGQARRALPPRRLGASSGAGDTACAIAASDNDLGDHP